MGAFDDLIPGGAAPQPQQGGAFDDLIPGAQPRATPQVDPNAFRRTTAEGTGQAYPTMDEAVYLAQSPYRGLGNLATAPFDLPNTVINLLSQGGTALANAVLPDEYEFEAPQLGMVAPMVRGAAADLAERAGVKVVAPEEVGPRTRILGNALDFATQGAGSGMGLANVALRKAGRKGVENLGPMLQQYAKKPVATSAVDTASGAGAGAGEQAAVENGIENPLVRFLAAAGGGYGGARLAQTAITPYAATRAILDRVLPSPDIAPDTVLPFSTPVTRNTEQQTAEALQRYARNPELAARNVAEGAAEMRAEGWSPATAGQLSNDPGLLYLEKRARLGSPSQDPKEPRGGTPEFVERDRNIQDQMAQSVDQLRPEGADPRVPTDLVGQEVRGTRSALDERRARAAEAISRAEADTAAQQGTIATEREQQLAAARQREQQAAQAITQAEQAEQAAGLPVRSRAGGQTAASETLATSVGEAKAADEARKRGLYQEAENLATGTTDARPYAAEVARIKRDLQPLASQDKAIANAMPDFERLLDDTGAGAVGVRDLIQMLPRLSAVQKSAVANMRGDVAEAIGRISDRIKGDLTERAKQGDQAALAWSAAERNFQTQFAPKYREGVGRQLDQAERRGQPVPPSKQAQLFLKPHGGGKEAAADMNRILTGASSEAAGKAAARDYVMADLASLVPDSGVIEPGRLRQWMANREGMLSQLPEVKRELDTLLADVVNRRDKTNATRQALDEAVTARKQVKLDLDKREKAVLANARLNEKQKQAELSKIDGERVAYERDLQNNAMRHLLDADPQHAVSGVMSSRDPERAMAQLVGKFSGNKDAAAGWKRAVADWVADQVSLKGAPDSISGHDPVSLNKLSKTLEKSAPALSKVFSPGEMNTLRRVQRALDVIARKGIGATTGSPTAENTAAMSIMELVLKQTLGNLEGGGQMRRFKLGLSLLPGTPSGARVDRLIERAMLDPELMQHLLTVPVRESAIPTWNRQLTRLLAARNTFAEGEE